MKTMAIPLLLCIAFLSCKKEELVDTCHLTQPVILDTPAWETSFGKADTQYDRFISFTTWTPKGILVKQTVIGQPDSLVLIDPETGRPIWAISLINKLVPDQTTIKFSESTVLVQEDRIFAGDGEFIHIFDLATGVQESSPLQGGQFLQFGSSPYPDKIWYTLVLSSPVGQIFSIEEAPLTLNDRHVLRQDTVSAPPCDAQQNVTGWIGSDGEPYLLFRLADGLNDPLHLVVQNLKSGEELWRRTDGNNPFGFLYETDIILHDAYILHADRTANQLHCLDRMTGEKKWSIPVNAVLQQELDWIYVSQDQLVRIHIPTGAHVSVAPSPVGSFVSLNDAHTYFAHQGIIEGYRNSTGCHAVSIMNPYENEGRYWTSDLFREDRSNKRVFVTDLFSVYAFDLP